MTNNYIYYKTTRSVCPVCHKVIQAKIVFIDNCVYMLKFCSTHGEFKSLISRDRQNYIETLKINKPATYPLKSFKNKFKGCTVDCGLCPEHQQHTCLPIIEITDHCNMKCPLCLASNHSSFHMKPGEFRGIIEGLLEAEGIVDLINISGGEPTLNPDLLEIIDIARRPEIVNVSLSTNGRIFLKNRDLLLSLIDKNVFISLQFDGFRPAHYKEMRGEDMLYEKLEILSLLEKYSARTSLVMTVVNGLNAEDIPEVVRYFLEKDFIKSLMFQPVIFVNEIFPYDESKVVTIPDVANKIAAGSDGIIDRSDIVNLPCSHPSCFALTYLLKLKGGGYVPLPKLIDIESYLDTIKNKTIPGLEPDSYSLIQDNIYRLWSSSGIYPQTEKITKTIKDLICQMGRLGRNPGAPEVFKIVESSIKSIFIHHFMDAYNFDISRAMKCCNQYALHGKKLVPCCVYNNTLRVR
ncbi:MAG: radical SAM protein [Syntrophomonadaceae bacterium]